MRLISIVVVSIVLLSASSTRSDESQDVAQLNLLISEVKAMLPPGWTVEFELADDRCGGSQAELVIKSTRKLPVEFKSSIGRSAAPLPGEPVDPPHVVQDVVSVELIFARYLTSDEYEAARKRNDALQGKRIRFIEDRLSPSAFAYKSPAPWPPTAYRPRPNEDLTPIRQYAFLWLATEPQPLPTHFYGTLALTAFDLHGLSSTSIEIHNSRENRAYQDILARLEKILMPYEKPAE